MHRSGQAARSSTARRYCVCVVLAVRGVNEMLIIDSQVSRQIHPPRIHTHTPPQRHSLTHQQCRQLFVFAELRIVQRRVSLAVLQRHVGPAFQ